MTDGVDNRLALYYAEQEREVRIVLLGKTGSGKSATGNTILGRKKEERAFISAACATSVTKKCQKETGEFEGQIVHVVDTPGLFDNILSKDKLKSEISKCISLSAPGPHVFLVVINSVNRFTEEEKETVEIIKMIFGEAAAGYTMVLFTRGDDLEEDGVSIEKFFKDSEPLRRFIRQCGGGYHLFNNKDEDPSQVRELLKKINSMVKKNGGRCYTNEMFEKAERVLREKMEKLLKENPNMTAGEARRQAQTDDNTLTRIAIALCSFVAGAGLGAGATVVGGAILLMKTKQCVIQ